MGSQQHLLACSARSEGPVPEGQHDISQARSAWNHEENSSVPAGRLNRSQLRSGASKKNLVTTCFSVRDSGISSAMANTSCSLNIHCIFSTKERALMLNPELRERLWQRFARKGREITWAKSKSSPWSLFARRISQPSWVFRSIYDHQRLLYG